MIVVDPFTVQFCALSIILLAFFILLNSMATLDKEKMRLALGSLIGTFGRMPGGDDPTPELGMLTNPDIEVSETAMEELVDYLSDLLEKENLGGDVDVFLRDKDVVIRIEGKALFVEGTDELLPGAETFLSAVAVTLSQSERGVLIEGHTDQHSTVRPEYGTPWLFAAARAARIHDFMLGQDLSAERLSVASLGSRRPHMPNETELQRSLNRRVEVVIEEGAQDPLFRPKSHVVDFNGYRIDVPIPSPQGEPADGDAADELGEV
jgi:chemotaxis protein MotB